MDSRVNAQTQLTDTRPRSQGARCAPTASPLSHSSPDSHYSHPPYAPNLTAYKSASFITNRNLTGRPASVASAEGFFHSAT